MRQLLPFCLFFMLLCSCTSDPDTKTRGTDSVIDTTLITNNFTDTFRVDNGDTTQTYYDCSVLSRIIPAETEQATIRNDLNTLAHCGIDSFDFLYVVPNLFPGFVSEKQVSGKKPTYGEFVKELNEFKTTDAYFQLHTRVVTLDSLRSTKYDKTKLYAMKPTLGKLGFTGPEWEMFSGFARTYPIPEKGRFTWGDMLEAFEKYRPR
ncbi:MAG: hypothetical protein M3R17_12290 [Bacteroidota bacterium]|nr:hypothetical protein [Bacteroidota bacterium]